MINKICENCKKEYLTFPSGEKRKYCSNKCRYEYQKENNIGFWNREMHSNNGKKGSKTQIENKIGMFSLSKKRKAEIIRKNHIEMKKNKRGFWSSEVQRQNSIKGNIINQQNGTGFWNPKIRNLIKHYKNIKFNDIYFASKKECETAMNIHYQLEEIRENYNYQFYIKLKCIDFFIRKYKCFIEYHPITKVYDKEETYESYYNSRRQILNEGGFKDCNLLVLA